MKELFKVVLLAGVLLPTFSFASEKLVLASREETLTNRFAELLLTEAYGRLKVDVEFSQFPGARSIEEANRGRMDGEVARLGFVLNQYKNLRKVPVPLFHSELSAFVNDKSNLNVVGWHSLEGHKATTMRGFKFVENKLTANSPNLVSSSVEAINLVEHDRTEVAVLNQFLGQQAVAELDAQHVKVISPPLERLPVYHFLHKKHEALIPKLTAILKDMERKGTLRDMWEDFSSLEILKVSKNPDVYILNTSTGAPYATPEHTGFQDLVVAEVFRRIGLKAEVSMYTASARALHNANSNIDHGVAMRIKNVNKKFPNLVRVDEPLIANDFVAYSKGLDLVTDDWKKIEPHSVAYINGWVIFERNLLPSQEKAAVTAPSQMFQMMDAGRVDLALYERWQGLKRAKDFGIDVVTHEPPLASVDMFMHVHRKHAHLAPRLARALRDMKADGTYQAIYDQVLTPLSKDN